VDAVRKTQKQRGWGEENSIDLPIGSPGEERQEKRTGEEGVNCEKLFSAVPERRNIQGKRNFFLRVSRSHNSLSQKSSSDKGRAAM